MDEAQNPFLAQHGRAPRGIVGRDDEFAAIDELLDATASGAGAAPLVFCGRSGVGTTVVVRSVEAVALERDWYAGFASPNLDEPLRETVARAFAAALTSFAARRPGAAAVRSAAEAVAGFCPYVIDDLPGAVAAAAVDTPRGSLGRDLRRLIASVGDGLRDLVGRGLVLVIDDLHRAQSDEIVDLFEAFTESMRDGQPVTLIAAGTPTLGYLATRAGIGGRVFDIAPLIAADARDLVRDWAASEGVTIDDDAVDAIVASTAGYPALVLLYAHAAWNMAAGPTVTAADVAAGAAVARDRLARDVLAPRFALAAAARRYVRAVAEADDPADSDAIARRLGDTTRFGNGASQLTELRDELVRRGVLTNINGARLAFAHPAARSYVLSWE